MLGIFLISELKRNIKKDNVFPTKPNEIIKRETCDIITVMSWTLVVLGFEVVLVVNGFEDLVEEMFMYVLLFIVLLFIIFKAYR